MKSFSHRAMYVSKTGVPQRSLKEQLHNGTPINILSLGYLLNVVETIFFKLIPRSGFQLAPPPRVYPRRFGLRTVQLMPVLKTKGRGQPQIETKPDGPKIFEEMSWDHEMDWSAAHLTPLIVYLRGNSSLQLPGKWRAAFPFKL